MTNEPSFKELGLMCTGDHSHVHLKGSEKIEVDGKMIYRNRTRTAGAYPPRLCRQWAQISRRIGPPGSKGVLPVREQHEFEQLLKEASCPADRQTSQNADALDHPNWQGEADCDPRILSEAQLFLSENPVVFGQFTKADIEKEIANKNSRPRVQ